jgi:hypothetical protein
MFSYVPDRYEKEIILHCSRHLLACYKFIYVHFVAFCMNMRKINFVQKQSAFAPFRHITYCM